MMADLWKERLAGLRNQFCDSIQLALTPNEDAEDLSCIICANRGQTCEWLVVLYGQGSIHIKGLHECCRVWHSKRTESKLSKDDK